MLDTYLPSTLQAATIACLCSCQMRTWALLALLLRPSLLLTAGCVLPGRAPRLGVMNGEGMLPTPVGTPVGTLALPLGMLTGALPANGEGGAALVLTGGGALDARLLPVLDGAVAGSLGLEGGADCPGDALLAASDGACRVGVPACRPRTSFADELKRRVAARVSISNRSVTCHPAKLQAHLGQRKAGLARLVLRVSGSLIASAGTATCA